MSSKSIHQEGTKFKILFRIVRCLDCMEIPTRKDNDCISLINTESDLNTEIKVKIRMLDRQGLTQAEICQELQFLYGNHLISNRRDRYKRT